MDYKYLDPLIEGLRELVGGEPLIEPLASVLADACVHASISYDSIIARAESDAQELILAARDPKRHSPLYELNPSLYPHRREDAATT